MNAGIFLARLTKELPAAQGDGIKRSAPLNLLTDIRTSGGLVLTGATSPLVAALETNALGLQVAAGQTAAGAFTFNVPVDYDNVADYLRIRLTCNSAGNTDSPTITAAVYRKRIGTALSANLAPAASAAVAKSATAATAAAVTEITVDTKSLQAGDQVTVVLTTSAHATDALNIYGVDVLYKSTIATAAVASR